MSNTSQISGEKEVMAQVKLAFTNSSGVQMIATRSMMLTVKKTTRTFKTLEGQLMAVKDGNRVTVSTRCADLDAQMPLFFGVSRAVLDNVIFCHQEESLWPLSEPSVLKKKFDEIFESQKFTKALDTIKAMRKDYTTDIKTQQQSTDFLRTDKERADKLMERADEASRQVEEYTTDADKLMADQEKMARELEELEESSKKSRQSLQELYHLRQEVDLFEQSIERLKSSTELFEGSDAELQSGIKNFSKQTDARRKRVLEVKNKISKQKSAVEGINTHYRETTLRQGQLQAASNRYHDLLSKRSDRVYQVADSLGLPKSTLQQINNAADKKVPLKPQDFANVFEILQDTNEGYRLQIDSERAKNAVADNDSTKKIQETMAEKLRIEHIAADLTSDIRKCTEKIASLKRTIDSVSVNESDITYEQSQLGDLEKKLEKAAETLERIKNDGGIAQKEASLSTLSAEIDALNADLKIVNEEADNRAKLSYLQEDLVKRDDAFKALVAAKTSDFTSVGIDLAKVGTPSFDVEKTLRESIEKRQLAHDESIHAHDSAKREQSLSESRLAMNKDSLSKLEKEKKLLQDKISEDVDITYEEYDERLADLEMQERELTSEIGQSNFLRELNGRALECADLRNTCLMCQREFHNHEKDAFVAAVEEKEARFSNAEEMKKSLDQLSEAIKVLRELAPSIDRLKTLEMSLIPYDLKEQPGLKESLDAAKAKEETCRSTVESAKTELERVEQLRRAASDITRGSAELANIRVQIETAQAQLRSDTGTTDMTSSQILTQLGYKNEESKRVDKELKAILEERDQARVLVGKLQNAINQKKQGIEDLRKQLEVRVRAELDIKTLEEERLQKNEQVAEEKKKVGEVALKIKGQEEEAANIKKEGAAREQEIVRKYSRLHDILRDLQAMNKDIESHETNGGEENLKQCHSLVETLQEQLQDTNAELDILSKELSQAEKELSDLNSHERMLKDNLEMRKLQAQVEDKQKRIVEIEGMDVEAENRKFRERESLLRNEKTKFFALHQGKMGEIKQLDDQISSIMRELDTSYANVHEKYRESLIKLQTLTVANEDMAKYARAMDSAIMKYHSLKMEEINRIIDELWKKTYSGTDVDTILIRSENETARGNRTYNYRVCMIKQDVELDMRGRCSAGQKVLASIIIRLALAECFGVNCGLIALDEPTTNLDADNIESLAKALNSIISTRRAQKNFQLIVITHDEKFLLHMNASSYTDHFYQVSRNEHQRSTIDWVPISRISE